MPATNAVVDVAGMYGLAVGAQDMTSVRYLLALELSRLSADRARCRRRIGVDCDFAGDGRASAIAMRSWVQDAAGPKGSSGVVVSTVTAADTARWVATWVGHSVSASSSGVSRDHDAAGVVIGQRDARRVPYASGP